ncbi:polysaccharide pyruvyl transferase family protein, partial [Vibrio sp. 10N.222.54.B11]|uniref:polysaccharide pyruvyl transferase family protein n=1 Tax=Vibrio sp. 10N.222.54.B11 TaxID=3229635 RepID=UPI003553B560
MDLLYISGIKDAYKENTDGLMYYSGFNLGNYAFRHGLSKMINVEEHKRINWRGCREFLKENGNPSELLLSCANWIGTSEHEERANGTRYELIKQMECPTIPVAIGAQSHGSVNDFSLGKNTKNLIALLSERSSAISVRDEFTQQALEKYGIKNSIITGCPSNFINDDDELGKKVQEKAQNLIKNKLDVKETRYHISEYSAGNAVSSLVLAKTLKILSKSAGQYIIQSPELLPFLLRETRSLPLSYKLPGLMNLTPKVKSLLNSRTQHFSGIEPWLDFSRTCDISFGMRIHGNMIPLQAEVPSIVVTHDTRTAGLSNTMCIPTIGAEEFYKIRSSQLNTVLLNKVIMTMGDYDTQRRELKNRFSTFFESNGLVGG